MCPGLPRQESRYPFAAIGTVFMSQSDRLAEAGASGVSDVTRIKTEQVERCVSCVLPRTLKEVSFDVSGRCSVCGDRQIPPVTSPLEEDYEPQLQAFVNDLRNRGTGHQYDCLVGISGGRDSTYLLHQLSRKHGLRCLAAYYRTPFTHSVVDDNVRRTAKILNVPLIDISISQERHRKVARDACLLWKKKPSAELINLSCVVCKLVHRELYRIARAHDVPTIVLGGNKYEEAQFLPAYVAGDEEAGAHSFLSQARKSLRVMRRGIAFLVKRPSIIRHLPMGVRASLMYLTPHTSYLQLRYPGVHAVEYFYVRPYDEKDCVRTIREELDWRLPPDYKTDWRADCAFADLKNYMFLKTVGVSYMDAFLSNMVRDGTITRDEALRRLADEGTISWERIRHAADVLDLPIEFFDGGERAAVSSARPTT